MKLKPAQREVMDNISSYSVEELENLSGPHFPKWIREVLVELHKRGGRTADEVAKEIAEKMIAASNNN